MGPTEQWVAPPATEHELLERAWSLAGMTLRAVAERHGLAVPHDLRRRKGWVGQVIERTLGATASSRPEPDFQALGIELKTIPVDDTGKPTESTYVCTVPLHHTTLAWESSPVRRKLRRVLWVPVQASAEVRLDQRRVGAPLLWGPNSEQEAVLCRDWEEIMELVCLGRIDTITAHHGACLQVRPKAANSRQVSWTTDECGTVVPTAPRGFYLRVSFTKQILEENFILPT